MSDQKTEDKTYTIVCVDDDPDMLAAVGRALAPLGHNIIKVDDPKQALAIVCEKDIAVLVSDFEMPGMTGVELTAAASVAAPDTVRVLMTGRKSLDTAVDGINHGEIYRYVQKPFDLKVMRKAVEEAFARHLDLAAASSDREGMLRREQLALELEQEYPNITYVAKTDGAYEVPPIDIASLVGLGLDSLIVACRR
jgi:DNA-binding NtrC family response regulator